MNRMKNFLTALPMVAMLGLSLSSTAPEFDNTSSNNVRTEVTTDANQNNNDLSSNLLALNDVSKSDTMRKVSDCTGTCTGTCDGACMGCSTTCSGTCDGSCSSTCSTTCSGTCDGSCSSTCSTSNKS